MSAKPILRRLGTKAKLLPKLLPMFPKHNTYFEPFFGGGSVFFAKERAQYSYLNDLDDEVVNVHEIWRDRRDELLEAIETTPIHVSLFKKWKKQEETDPLWKAVRYLYLCNFSYMGTMDILSFGKFSSKEVLEKRILKYFDFITDVQWNCCDFEKFFTDFQIRRDKQGRKEHELSQCFAYLDPPYLGTENNYISGFTEADCVRLFDCVMKWGGKFCYSEFNNPFILQQAKERGLHVWELGERKNLGNRRVEIIVTNYVPEIMQNKELKLF
jgi:DNA adenine methylase